MTCLTCCSHVIHFVSTSFFPFLANFFFFLIFFFHFLLLFLTAIVSLSLPFCSPRRHRRRSGRRDRSGLPYQCYQLPVYCYLQNILVSLVSALPVTSGPNQYSGHASPTDLWLGLFRRTSSPDVQPEKIQPKSICGTRYTNIQSEVQ